jgi:hypothetical protein
MGHILYFQNTITYFAKTVSYSHKMFMKWAPVVHAESGGRIEGHAGLALADVAAFGVDALAVGAKIWSQYHKTFLSVSYDFS